MGETYPELARAQPLITETLKLEETRFRRTLERGLAILLVEHDMALVMEISERVAVLDHGRKIAEGSPREIAADPAVIAAYLGTDADGDGKIDAPPASSKGGC